MHKQQDGRKLDRCSLGRAYKCYTVERETQKSMNKKIHWWSASSKTNGQGRMEKMNEHRKGVQELYHTSEDYALNINLYVEYVKPCLQRYPES